MRSRAHWWLFAVALEIAALSVASAATPKTNAKADPNAQLGSPTFRPTPDRPVGWRGDGSGRYPGATPPTTWECKRQRRDSRRMAFSGRLAAQHRRLQPDHRRRPDFHHRRSVRPGLPRQENRPRFCGFARIPNSKGSTRSELQGRTGIRAKQSRPLARQLGRGRRQGGAGAQCGDVQSAAAPRWGRHQAEARARKADSERRSRHRQEGLHAQLGPSRVRLQRPDADQRRHARLRLLHHRRLASATT